MNKCKRGASAEVEFEIMKYLMFSLVLKERCSPHEEMWRIKNGHIE